MKTLSTTEDVLKQMEDLTQGYLAKLEAYSLEQLKLKPSEDEWSLGQMYVHLAQTALFMQLRNVEACRTDSAPPSATDNAKTDAGAKIFELGSFPPIRIQVPASPAYTPAQPESKEQIEELFRTALERMRAAATVVDGIPSERTADHPRLGALNAREWYNLVAMHYRHHLLQQERLEAMIRSVDE